MTDLTAAQRRAYAVHSGYIHSVNDGERHYISFMKVAELYGLTHSSQFICWDIRRPETIAGRNWDDYIHLFPREDGGYTELFSE